MLQYFETILPLVENPQKGILLSEFLEDKTLAGFSIKPKAATNGFLVLSIMPFKRVFILHHHHAKHRYNPHRCEKI